MKLIKSTIMAVAAVAALGFTACSDDNDYNGAAQPKGVFFPNNLPTSFEVLATNTTLEIPVERIGSTEAATYAITAIYDEDVFTMPQSVTFADGATESAIVVGYNPAYMQQDFGFDITIEFNAADASSAGNRVLQAQVMLTPPWSDWAPYSIDARDPQGTFNYSLNWYFGGSQPSVLTYYRYNTEDPNRFQLNLSNWGDGEVSTGSAFTVEGKEVNRGLIMNVDNGVVEVPLQDTGIDIEFTNGTFRLGVMDWNTYRALNGVAADPAAECTFDKDKGLFNLYLAYAVNVDGTWYPQSSGWESYQMDGYPDYSMTVEYQGLTTNADVTESSATFMATIADGLTEAHFAMSRTMSVADLTQGLKDGSIANYEMLNPGEEQTFSILLEGAGDYTIVGVGFDEEGNAVNEVSQEFTISNGVSEWKKAGNAEYYDAWVTAAFSFGSGEDKRTYLDFPWNVEVLESVKQPGLYALLAPYCSTDWVMNNETNRKYGIFTKVNITIDCTNPECVVIAPQFTGYTMKAGSMADGKPETDVSYNMANRAGLAIEEGQTKDQVIAAGENDKLIGNTIEVNMPQVNTSDEEGWGVWNINPAPVGKITFDFIESDEAEATAVRAKIAAREMMQMYAPNRMGNTRILKKARVLKTDKML